MRNSDGCSACVTTTGNKGKGDAELFNSLDTENSAWEGIYTKPTLAGGILTIRSLELGEPIHKVVTRFGLVIVSWILGAAAHPAVPYLASVPISFPLIGLTQLVQYLVVCHVAGLTPGELRSRLSGATGHSQGIVSAIVIATSGTFEEFVDNSHKAIKWLFYSGLRGQQAFPVTSVEPSIVQDAIAGGEGTPSPMLSIAGLTLKELQPHIRKTNQHLSANSQLHVSLHNGPKTFVVTGPPKALFGLVTSSRKVRAQSGLDQGKTPLS